MLTYFLWIFTADIIFKNASPSTRYGCSINRPGSRLLKLLRAKGYQPVLRSLHSKLRYNYTNLDQLHISPVNSTRRVLQKISLHHRSILSASSRKKHWSTDLTVVIIISLPCSMYERRRLHELSTDNLSCSPPVWPFRPGFFRPIERYDWSAVSSDHLADVFQAWCPAWCFSLNFRVSLCDRSISDCVISLAPTGPCLGLPFAKTSSFVTCST